MFANVEKVENIINTTLNIKFEEKTRLKERKLTEKETEEMLGS